MSFEKGNKKLKRHILSIRQLISNPDLRGLAEETGAMGEAFLQMHNIQSKFLGGEYANKPYSRTNLPLFFFGEAVLVERTGNMRLSNPELQITNLLIRAQDIDWFTTREGKKMPFLKGGYSTFLKYARPGKNLNKVNHEFSGAMLRNLTHDMVFETNGATIRWYVRPPHDRKAYYTNLQREWMGFFQEEVDQIAQMAARKFGLIIYETLLVE